MPAVPRPRHPRRLIWFCDTDRVAPNPGWLARLRDEIGLTTLMAEDFTHHTSGFAASPDVAARSPLGDWPNRRELLDLHLGPERAARGVYPVVPGILGGVDDSNLRALLDAAGRAGIEVWGHIGLWSYAGEVFPEFSMRDVWGRPPDLAYRRWGIGFCPSKRAINQWVAEGLADVTRRYGVAGYMVDHARYPAPASVSAMFGCACDDCAAEGRRLGYDVDAIYAAVRELPARLAALPPDRLLRAAAQVSRAAGPGGSSGRGPGKPHGGAAGGSGMRRTRAEDAHGPDAGASLADWLAWAGGGAGQGHLLVAWLELRCHLLAARMAEFRAVVRRERDAGTPAHPAAARSPEIVWGSDVFPPGVALYGGHQYGLWRQGADYLTGGASHGGVVGWATAVTNVAFEWARFLRECVPALDEATALHLLYRLLGYDDLAAKAPSGAAPHPTGTAEPDRLPLESAPLERGDIPVLPIYAREVARLVAGAPPELPLYPPISAGRDRARLAALCRVVAEAGVDGALLSGLNPDDPEQLDTLRRSLGPT